MFQVYFITFTGYIGKILDNIIKLFTKYNSLYCFVLLPVKIKKLTILKSPHIFKKSREQFETRISKRLMILKINDSELSTFNKLLSGISWSIFNVSIKKNSIIRLFIFIILILIILHLDISLCEISGEVGDISGDTDNASIQRQTRIGIVILSISLFLIFRLVMVPFYNDRYRLGIAVGGVYIL